MIACTARRITLAAFTAGMCIPLAGSPAGLAAGMPAAAPAPAGALAVERGDSWHTWWRANHAPTQWTAPLPAVAGTVVWRHAAPGLDWGELRLSGPGEAWRIRVILARLDPRRLRLTLDTARSADGARADWTIDRAPPGALLAVNTGQFTGTLPWGWVVMHGREFLPPEAGPLSTAIVIDSAGPVHLIPPRRIARSRHAPGVAAAFQAYPTLLSGNGIVPPALRPARDTSAMGGINRAHRDARLALGLLRDGRVLLALTRFDALGGSLDFVPFGLTTPEMAALMGALGCERAVMLDGGISSQLLLRTTDGITRRWPGLRRVPLGLVALPRRRVQVAPSDEVRPGAPRRQARQP